MGATATGELLQKPVSTCTGIWKKAIGFGSLGKEGIIGWKFGKRSGRFK